MNAPWLSVVGVGEDGLDGLGASARARIDTAEVLIGGARHLAFLPEDGRRRLTWPSPFDPMLDRIEAMRGTAVCVLATGDPLCFGIAARLVERFPIDEVHILPAPSAFALAAARMGWPAESVETVTLHGRPVEALRAVAYPGARILALSAGAETPAAVARMLIEDGFGPSLMTVLERMGGPAETRHEARADAWGEAPTGAALNTLAIACEPEPELECLAPRLPGLPDTAFRHDGQITKREVRAATLSGLSPRPGQLLWDVGAGCGSVAVEWMRLHPRNRAVAVERSQDRAALIVENAARLGTPDLTLVTGEAPAALTELPAPDAVFVGGGIGTDGIAERCWDALPAGGRMAANAVTLEGEERLAALHARHGGSLTRMAIVRAEAVGPFRGWRPSMPVTLWAARKP